MTAAIDRTIRVDDLTFAYRHDPVLQDVTFSLDGGAIGLLGPNGSGKTTLLRTLMGQVPLRPGHVTVAGCDMPPRPAADAPCSAGCRNAAASSPATAVWR